MSNSVPPTAPQMSFIKSLLDELAGLGHDELRAPLNQAYAARTLTVESASGVIENLKELRDFYRAEARQAAPAPAPSAVDVPAGHYALVDDEGTVKFYEVQHGAEGSKWAGFTFLSACASDERYPIKNRQSKDAILGSIAADPMEAMKLYGREIGCCGHCGRTLTSDYRKIGIGPVCSRKFG